MSHQVHLSPKVQN